MEKNLEQILGILLKLDDRVLEVGLAHGNMIESLLEALTVAKNIDTMVSRKWHQVVRSHRKLGKEIQQLLQELNDIKHQINADLQTAVNPES